MIISGLNHLLVGVKKLSKILDNECAYDVSENSNIANPWNADKSGWRNTTWQWILGHGSLEGVGGLKTIEAYHSKADALLIPERYFFENLPTPFFGNVCFIKFGQFSALLALPVMIREEYGQMAHQRLPNILLSNASLVTKSCIARFIDDDAFNPCALSNCSTGPSPPLAHGKSTLSSFLVNAGCLRPGLFGRFRSISEQTAHPSRKTRAQREKSPFHVL